MSGSRASTDQQLGKVIGLIEGLKDQLDQNRIETTRQVDRANAEAQRVGVSIGSIQTEQARAAAVITSQVNVLTGEVKVLSETVRGIETIKTEVRAIAVKVDRLEELKEPVLSATAFKNQLMVWGAVFSAIGIIGWAIFGDFIKSHVGLK